VKGALVCTLLQQQYACCRRPHFASNTINGVDIKVRKVRK